MAVVERKAEERAEKGKGRSPSGGPRSPSPKPKPTHCFDFLKTGKCAKGSSCNFEHLTSTQLDAKKAKEKAAPRGGAVGNYISSTGNALVAEPSTPQAKPVAVTQPAHVVSPHTTYA